MRAGGLPPGLSRTLFLAMLFCGVVLGSEYKCLQCNRTTDLMCYLNQTCEEGQKVCYTYKWEAYNTNYTIYDAEYYINHREWGCTESMESCFEECAASGCNTSKIACCDANLDLLNTSEGIFNYQRCLYGAGERPARGWGVVVVAVLGGLLSRLLVV